jgi:hypothetical protein
MLQPRTRLEHFYRLSGLEHGWSIAGPAQAQGGPAADWYFVFILYILDILDMSWIYLDMFGYMFGIFVWYIFGTIFYKIVPWCFLKPQFE